MLSKVWRAIARFSEDIDVSLSRERLGFVGVRDPESATSGKKQRERIDSLASACAQKIEMEIFPALRARAGWAKVKVLDGAQTLTAHQIVRYGRGRAQRNRAKRIGSGFISASGKSFSCSHDAVHG